MSKTLVAVYGTLKRGQSNHGLLSDSQFVSLGETLPNYSLLEMGGYPGAIYGQQKLVVEVFSVSPEVLARLDQLEGHPSYYERKEIPITLPSGEIIKAWMYTISHLSSSYSGRPISSQLDTYNRLDWKGPVYNKWAR
jgi:gamma-glutamylcyclotransferase (GGCT)/AIG2-like uncharacterized protein YtfP